MRNRYDETWHRLREWTKGQAPSERLAAQILISQGFSNLDPSHPLGGRDGGKDAIADKDGARYAMAVYFPRGQQSFGDIKKKFETDLVGANLNSADGISFVTNQELTLGEREELKQSATPTAVDLFHLERITMILDTPPMAKIREQFLEIETESPPTIQLGGQGGNAPGAGGGGGGAIGEGARGGRGGDGGRHQIDTGEFTLPLSKSVLDSNQLQSFEENMDFKPGAGAGGPGAIGKDSRGGDGGGGGDCVTAAINLAELNEVEFEHIQITIGRAGVDGHLPGQHGQKGEDTIAEIRTKDGIVLKSIRASGGRGGRAASSYFPDGVTEISLEDIERGFRVSTLMPLNAAEIRDDLLFILGGGWTTWNVQSIPSDAIWHVLCIATWQSLEEQNPRGIFLALFNPAGHEVSCQALVVPAEVISARYFKWIVPIGANVDMAGIWRIGIYTGEYLLTEIGIEVPAQS